MRRIVTAFTRPGAELGAVATFGIMIGVVTDVIARSLGDGSVPGVVDVSETLLVAVVFFGLANAENKEVHVRMTLVTSRLNLRVRNLARCFSFAITSGYVGWLTWATYFRALDALQSGEYRFGLVRWPLWPARWVIVVGLALLLITTIAKTYYYARATVRSSAGWLDDGSDRHAPQQDSPAPATISPKAQV